MNNIKKWSYICSAIRASMASLFYCYKYNDNLLYIYKNVYKITLWKGANMAKRNDRIITSVYLTKEMCEQVDRMAAKGHISRNEQIRRYIEKGLDVESYSQNIDFIAGIIR